MRVHSIEKIKKLIELRKQGYSINELVEKFSIPKTTVWHHVHNIKIPEKYSIILRSKWGGSAKRKQNNLEKAKQYAQELLNSSYKEFLIVISMLYWGEGSKKVCEFINSDGRMIEVYLIILREVLKIPEESIKPTMRIFSGMNEFESLDYWSKITKIKKNKFLIRFNDGGTKCKKKYGMCRITIKKGSNSLKLMHSLIDLIYKEVLNFDFTTLSPRSLKD